MLDPLVISYNNPVSSPPFVNIRWLKIDESLEWVSKQINSSLEWVSTSSQSAQNFNLTSTVATTSGTITQGCNSLEVMVLSGSATINGIPLTANGLKGFKFPALDHNEVYSAFSYTVSGELLIVESRTAIALAPPDIVTATGTNLANASGNTPNNAKWLTFLLREGTATLDNIPLSMDGINGYELPLVTGKLYNFIPYVVDLNSTALLVCAN